MIGVISESLRAASTTSALSIHVGKGLYFAALAFGVISLCSCIYADVFFSEANKMLSYWGLLGALVCTALGGVSSLFAGYLQLRGEGFALWQPFRGGLSFTLLQYFGWLFFGVSMSMLTVFLYSFEKSIASLAYRNGTIAAVGCLSFAAILTLMGSLPKFDGNAKVLFADVHIVKTDNLVVVACLVAAMLFSILIELDSKPLRPYRGGLTASLFTINVAAVVFVVVMGRVRYRGKKIFHPFQGGFHFVLMQSSGWAGIGVATFFFLRFAIDHMMFGLLTSVTFLHVSSTWLLLLSLDCFEDAANVSILKKFCLSPEIVALMIIGIIAFATITICDLAAVHHSFLYHFALLCQMLVAPVMHVYASITVKGYALWQPFAGGSRFIVLHGIGWCLFAVAHMIVLLALWNDIYAVVAAASLFVLMTDALICISFHVFEEEEDWQSLSQRREIANSKSNRRAGGLSLFSSRRRSELQVSPYLNGELVTSVLLALGGFMTLSVADYAEQRLFQKAHIAVFGVISMLLAPALAHVSGRRVHTSYAIMKPFTGGADHVALQTVGWTLWGTTVIVFAILEANLFIDGPRVPTGATTIAAVISLVSYGLVVASIPLFDNRAEGTRRQSSSTGQSSPSPLASSRGLFLGASDDVAVRVSLSISQSPLLKQAQLRKLAAAASEAESMRWSGNHSSTLCALLKEFCVAVAEGQAKNGSSGVTSPADSIHGVYSYGSESSRNSSAAHFHRAAGCLLSPLESPPPSADVSPSKLGGGARDASGSPPIAFAPAPMLSFEDDASTPVTQDGMGFLAITLSGGAVVLGSVTELLSFVLTEPMRTAAIGPACVATMLACLGGCLITHCISGSRRYPNRYKWWMPFGGGSNFTLLQTLGWALVSTHLSLFLTSMYALYAAGDLALFAGMFFAIGFFGFAGHMFLVVSLSQFDVNAEVRGLMQRDSFLHRNSEWFVGSILTLIFIGSVTALEVREGQQGAARSGGATRIAVTSVPILFAGIFSCVAAVALGWASVWKSMKTKHGGAVDSAGQPYNLSLLTETVAGMIGLLWLLQKLISIETGGYRWVVYLALAAVVHHALMLLTIVWNESRSLTVVVHEFVSEVLTFALYSFHYLVVALLVYLGFFVKLSTASVVFFLSMNMLSFGAESTRRLVQSGAIVMVLSDVVGGTMDASWFMLPLLAYTMTYHGHAQLNRSRRISSLADCDIARRCWDSIARYFTLKIVTRVKDPRTVYGCHEAVTKTKIVFGFHPHGVCPYTCLWATMGSLWSQHGLPRPVVHVSSFLMSVPIVRDLLMTFGVVDCTMEALRCSFESPSVESLLIVPGGQKECTQPFPSSHSTTLFTRNKGLFRFALSTGATLVPMFCFGETDTMGGLPLPTFQFWAKRKLGITYPQLPHGRLMLPLPRRVPLYLAVGEPILVAKVVDPKPHQVDELHALYYGALRALFDAHKEAAGYPNTELTLL